MKVFVNCPLDDEYTPLLRGILFTLLYLGQTPSVAVQDTDSARNRLDKIVELMRTADISIHDLSRIRASGIGEFFRMNMPFELGVDYGIRAASANPAGKRFIVLEEERFSYHKAISDYSGFDVVSHHGSPARLVKVIRDWFVNNRVVSTAPGGKAMWYAYNDCWAYMYERLLEQGYSHEETAEVPHAEFTGLTADWLAQSSTSI